MKKRNIKVPELQIPYEREFNDESVARVLAQQGRLVKINTVNWPDYPSHPRCRVSIGHAGRTLWLMFEGDFNDFRITVGDDLDAVASDNCFEVFITGADSSCYWNFEFNASGACNASHRRTRENPVRLTADQLRKIIRSSKLEGRIVRGVRRYHWRLITGIPLGLTGTAPGRTLAANFYACAGKANTPYYLSWNPIESETPDFHRPESFGQLILQ